MKESKSELLIRLNQTETYQVAIRNITQLVVVELGYIVVGRGWLSPCRFGWGETRKGETRYGEVGAGGPHGTWDILVLKVALGLELLKGLPHTTGARVVGWGFTKLVGPEMGKNGTTVIAGGAYILLHVSL